MIRISGTNDRDFRNKWSRYQEQMIEISGTKYGFNPKLSPLKIYYKLSPPYNNKGKSFPLYMRNHNVLYIYLLNPLKLKINLSYDVVKK